MLYSRLTHFALKTIKNDSSVTGVMFDVIYDGLYSNYG